MQRFQFRHAYLELAMQAEPGSAALEALTLGEKLRQRKRNRPRSFRAVRRSGHGDSRRPPQIRLALQVRKTVCRAKIILAALLLRRAGWRRGGHRFSTRPRVLPVALPAAA